MSDCMPPLRVGEKWNVSRTGTGALRVWLSTPTRHEAGYSYVHLPESTVEKVSAQIVGAAGKIFDELNAARTACRELGINYYDGCESDYYG